MIGTCVIKVEDGLKCGEPAHRTIEVRLPPHDYLYYVKEAELLPIPICRTHSHLFSLGWKLQPQVIFRWVPPRIP